MKFILFFAALLFLGVMLTMCKEHTGDFRLENQEFMHSNAQLLKYQHHLDIKLSEVADQRFVSLVTKRKTSLNAYTLSLASLSTVHKTDLTTTAKADLAGLDTIQGAAYNRLLIELTVQADQELIGLHVKASGPTGLKDASLREWTAQQLPMLLKRLDNSQALWHEL